MNGIINVKKEKGFTSFDVVAKLRGILHQKKMGHTGTLDPDATGVLPVCIGKSTKVCGLLTDKDKVYEATLLLGVTTDTLDMTGTVLQEKEVTCSEAEVETVIKSFEGKISQIPPMYSALKVNGRKLCDLARDGVEVERKAREVEIFSIQIKKMALPRVVFEVHCSKGTYIRTLCQDIGEKLGCGGAMETLLRKKVANFTLEEAHTIDEIEAFYKNGELDKILLPTDTVFPTYTKGFIVPEAAKILNNGNKLKKEDFSEALLVEDMEEICVYNEKKHFAGIYRWEQEQGFFRPVKMFLENE